MAGREWGEVVEGRARADAFTRDLLSGSDAATVVRAQKMNKNDAR